MSNHTPEPWDYGFPKINGQEFRETDCQISMGDCLIANVSHGPIYPAEPFASQAREANDRRIVACVNACRGLDTDYLEKMPLGGVLNATAELLARRDELLEELVITLGSLKEICNERGALRPESTIRRAEAAIAKAKGGAA